MTAKHAESWLKRWITKIWICNNFPSPSVDEFHPKAWILGSSRAHPKISPDNKEPMATRNVSYTESSPETRSGVSLSIWNKGNNWCVLERSLSQGSRKISTQRRQWSAYDRIGRVWSTGKCLKATRRSRRIPIEPSCTELMRLFNKKEQIDKVKRSSSMTIRNHTTQKSSGQYSESSVRRSFNVLLIPQTLP